MPDEIKNTGYDDSFWADVDALRAMLEEEETNVSAAPPKVPPCSKSAEPAEKQLIFQSQNTGSADFKDYDFSREAQPAHNVKSSKKQKKSRSHRRSSKGLIITLYVIIALELTALCGVAASWYLWMQ